MDTDDEFGDLYADIGPEVGKKCPAEPLGGERPAGPHYEEDEELLYGTSSPFTTSSFKPPSSSSSAAGRSDVQLELTMKEVDNDELLLYGQLYGVSAETRAKARIPLRSFEIGAFSISGEGEGLDCGEDVRLVQIAVESSSHPLVEDRVKDREDLSGKKTEIPLGGVRAASGNLAMGIRTDDRHLILEGFGNHVLPSDDDAVILRTAQLVVDMSLQTSSPPGLSNATRVQPELITQEEQEEREMSKEWGEGAIEEIGEAEAIEGEGEDWDSDSEDDIQIVLNEVTTMYAGERPANRSEVEGSEDEDEVDLVIVSGRDDALPIDEQEWDEQPMPADALTGVLGGALSAGSDRIPGGEDRGLGGKGSGGAGTSPSVPRIGYSGQGYHAHHMQFKYVRPGSGVALGPTLLPSQGSPQAGVLHGRGIAAGSAGAWGPGRLSTARGEWSGGRGDWSSFGRGSANQRSAQGSGGVVQWGPSRGLQSGIEFSLPPTKTVFDVDLDSLEEKPWRRVGVDITDYFNFSFTESSWKQYCRQLTQLRLEATMQTKIRVYESGRSEQEYDPDLPPELAAAAGMQDTSEDLNVQQRQQDGGLAGVSGRGRGSGRGRMMHPPGRAIQVEGGGGERRPSADVRRQRTRDSDAVIQIVLQDTSEDEPPVSVPCNEANEEFDEDYDERGCSMFEQERHFYRSELPSQWELEGPPNIWERGNRPMGSSAIPAMVSHGGGMVPGCLEMEGPGPFSMGPGIPLHQPGPGRNFGIFSGAQFGSPVRRGGMLRLPLYNGLRAGLPLPLAGPPPENFPPVMFPLEYHDPMRRRTPPHSSPHKAPPQVLSVDWDDDMSNASGPNWRVRDGHCLRESEEFDGMHADWPNEGVERHGNNCPVRRGRDPDRSSLRERSVDEVSAECRSEEQKRSISWECHLEDDDWDVGYSSRIAKKQKIQLLVNSQGKVGRGESNRSEVLKSNVSKAGPTLSWDPSKEQATPEEEISQHEGYTAWRSITNEWKLPGEESLGSQKKDVPWNARQGDECKDRKQREREEVYFSKVKLDIYQPYNKDGQEWEWDKEDPERERRLGKKEETERVVRDDRSKRQGDYHKWVSCGQELGTKENGKSPSAEREAEHIKEKRRRDEDQGSKLKSRLEDLRENDGRLKGRVEDLRESDGRAKAHLEEHREGDGRLRGRLEDVRESEGRMKGHLEDSRECDKREIGGRVRVCTEDVKDIDRRVRLQLEEVRESDGRGRRHGKEDEVRGWDDRRKYEKSRRGEGAHTTRNHAIDIRKVEEHHPHKRTWELSTNTKELQSERDGSLSGLVGDKSHRSHTDGSKKHRVEEYRASSQFDKVSTRELDDLAMGTSIRHKERQAAGQKRVEDHFNRRAPRKPLTSRQHRVSKDCKTSALETVSSEDEGADRRGRSKLERWTSRKERDAQLGQSNRQNRQNSEARYEEARSTHWVSAERGQNSKEEQKGKHQLVTYSGTQHLDLGMKEFSGQECGGDSAPELQTVVPKDAVERRKERLERLRLQAVEVAAERQKNGDLPQMESVEEVKQERPARKRRWGNG